MPLEKLGTLNADWGVCGFTSCLYGLWDVLPEASRSQIHGGTKAHRLLAEIKSYLVMLKAEGNLILLNEIQTFCRKFGAPGNQFGAFTIDSYIGRVNASVNKTEKQIKADENFGIGLPPQAVVDYLKRMWGRDASLRQAIANNSADNGIIGVKNVNKPLSHLYGGLEHYMYRYNQLIYSWGESFNSVDAASAAGAPKNTKWEVCCLITL